MANYATTKYGTKIDVTGLTPDDIKKVMSVAQDKGAYGAKGAALANALRAKKGATGTKTPATQTQTDYFDSTNKLKDADAVVGGLQQTPNADFLQAEIQKARDGAYNYMTRNYERDKAREIEDAQQTLAMRGIPIDAGADSLWTKTIGGINENYRNMYDQASNQAYTAALGQGTDAFNSAVTATTANNDAFLKAVLGMTDADLQRYGIDKDFQAKMAAVAKSGANRGGGGGSSNGNGNAIIGGVAPGFGV